MSSLKALLEQFDSEPDVQAAGRAEPLDIRLQQEKASAYAAGYAAGEAAAKSKSTSDTEFLENALAKLDQALKKHIVDGNAQLTKALLSVIDTVFPALAEKALPEELTAIINRHPILKTDSAAILTLSPKQASAFQKRIEAVRTDLSVRIEADKAMNDMEASITWEKAGVDVNFGKTIEEIEIYLGALLDQFEKRNA